MSEWRKVRVRLVTPAFIGGARARRVDRHQPFRVASVRGLLRSWFRAGVGACLALDGDEERDRQAVVRALRDAEGLLFGSASGNGGSRASALVLRPCPEAVGGTVVSFPRPEGGLRYAGYGLFEDKWRAPEVLEGGGEIQLPMRLRVDAPARAEEALAASIWLWAHLGGIGARSRRGWGSLELVDLGGLPWDGPPVGVEVASVRDVLERLSGGLDHATSVFERYLRDNGFGALVRGGARHPSLRTIDGIEYARGLPHEWRRPLDALDAMGRLLQRFRSTLERSKRKQPPLGDYHAVKQSLREPRPVPSRVERAAFGLPLPFYFRSLGGANTIFVADSGHRMPSPLILRVARVGPGDRCWGGLMIYLAEHPPGGDGSPMRPLGGRSLLQDGHHDRRIAEPDGRIVVDFMHWAIEEIRREYPKGARR